MTTTHLTQKRTLLFRSTKTEDHTLNAENRRLKKIAEYIAFITEALTEGTSFQFNIYKRLYYRHCVCKGESFTHKINLTTLLDLQPLRNSINVKNSQLCKVRQCFLQCVFGENTCLPPNCLKLIPVMENIFEYALNTRTKANKKPFS